jgi:hypothetical protein
MSSSYLPAQTFFEQAGGARFDFYSVSSAIYFEVNAMKLSKAYASYLRGVNLFRFIENTYKHRCGNPAWKLLRAWVLFYT